MCFEYFYEYIWKHSILKELERIDKKIYFGLNVR